VIVGAHFDHLGYGEDGNSVYKGSTRQIHNGADDNASGTAALLALAEDIKLRGNRMYNYIFVAFGSQEMGMQGSSNFATNNPDAVTHANYMINLDMVGRLNERKQNLTISGVQTASQWGNSFKATLTGIKVKLDSTIVAGSDQATFAGKNVPALNVSTGTHADYHKPTDDTDKVNYEGENDIIKYLLELTGRFDAMPAMTFNPIREARHKPASK
jgi:Zn-dependent M28 family amino/carboxypeptidase